MEFNKCLHEASIPRGDVHIIKVLQLHILSQGAVLGVFIIFSDSSSLFENEDLLCIYRRHFLKRVWIKRIRLVIFYRIDLVVDGIFEL